MERHPIIGRIEGQIVTVENAELTEDVTEMALYGLFADEKFSSNLLVAARLRDEVDDFLFPSC
jgi:hypothetical protein